MTDNRRPVTIDEIRTLQLDILDAVHDFCRQHGLRYSLGGGTLLGAVRHKGYIPWDDDIDIMLPRPDYERFIREFKCEGTHMAMQNARLDPACILMFTKIYDTRTVLEEADRLRNGVAIDIFPIDGLPAPDALGSYISTIETLHHNLLNNTRTYRLSGWKLLKYYLKKLKYPSRDKTLDALEQLTASHDFDTSDYAGAICGSDGEKEHMQQPVFTSYVTLPFEGRQYMAIADWDAYLTKHYGDYMKLPPKEQQVSEHPYKVWWKEQA